MIRFSNKSIILADEKRNTQNNKPMKAEKENEPVDLLGDVPCKTCKWRVTTTEKCEECIDGVSDNYEVQEPCEDCVSRRAVIRLLHSGYHSTSMIDEVKKLPSAKPEPVRINLNELIKVKLTDWGKEIYYHQYDRTNQIVGRKVCKPMFPKEDENGYTEFQLWCFIELYGEHIGMTLPNVIEPLEIVYERRINE